MSHFSFLFLIFVAALLQCQQFTAMALKCYTCNGICDCRDNQLPETCARGAVCYTVKAAISGQVIRKGCTPECKLVTSQGWQKCHLCDGDDLCNDADYRQGLFDDCAVEELFSAGLGIPQQHQGNKKTSAGGYGYGRSSQQPSQYRRSLTNQYAGDGASGGQSPQVTAGSDGSYGGGGGYSQPQQTSGGYGRYGSPQQQQQPQAAGPNSFLVQQPAITNSGGASANSGEDSSSFSAPGLTAASGDSSQQQVSSSRVNAFLDRMSPRSVPIGFGGGQATENGRQQQPFLSPSANFGQPWAQPNSGQQQQFPSFGSALPNQPPKFGADISAARPNADFGTPLSPQVNAAAPPSGLGARSLLAPALMMMMAVVAAVLM